jgi:hypothetical protein
MSSASQVRTESVSRELVILGPELIDELAEAVASPPDAHSRSAAICSLVREMYETLEWLHSSDPHNHELHSLRLLVDEAEQHQTRMSARHDALMRAGAVGSHREVSSPLD